MRARFFRSVAIVSLVALLFSPATAQDEKEQNDLPNFHKVHDFLYRGAQPKRGSLRKLAELGIKTVVNLRGEGELVRQEQKEAESAGLRYFNIPLSRIGRPSDDRVARIIAIIDSSENQPVFVHCKLGSDRTGTIIAIHRLLHDGWTDKQAITEARRHGMNWIEFAMRDYISDYYKEKAKPKDRSN